MYNDMIDDFFSEELDKTSIEELLLLAGTDILRDEDIDKDAVRAGTKAYAKKANLKSSEIILELLPNIRQIFQDNPSFERLTPTTLSAFITQTKELFSSFNLKKKTIFFLSVSILKNGLKPFLPIEGVTPFEAKSSYLEFDLKISKNEILSISADGEIYDELLFDQELLKRYLILIENNDIESAKKYGEFLWNILFPSKINNHFERCIGMTQSSNFFKGVRIRLSINNEELVKVPWELARYPQTGEHLAVSSNIILSRYIHRQGRLQNRQDFPTIDTLGVLIAEPESLNKVNAQYELEELKKIENNPMSIIEITPGTSENLREVVEKYSIDILHYIGHGGFSNDEGYLLLESSNEIYDKYSSDRVANILNMANNNIQIVILNSCKGAESSSHTHFSGVATRLMQKNIPAVVAMQYNITNQSASIFSKVFYQSIIDGFPIEYSVQKGRQAIFNDIGDIKKDFITPCLFLDY